MQTRIKYVRIGDPSKTRIMSGSQKFNREAGWIPYVAPEKVNQTEKPDERDKPIKPKTPTKTKIVKKSTK